MHLVVYLISRCNGHLSGKCTFDNFASRATDATRRDKAWDRAGKLRLVMRNRTILVAVLISPYLSQKVAGLGVRVSAGSTLRLDKALGSLPSLSPRVVQTGDPVDNGHVI